ncbi:MAG: M48 family metallopeptidase [Terracidiphilus sp.]
MNPPQAKSILAALFCLALLCIFGTQPAWARTELQPCKNSMPPEKQIEIGNKAARQVYQRMPVLPDSSPVAQYVQALGEKLAAHAPGYRWPYNFHVVNVDDINAFALPGGSIFVNLGTIQAADTEAQLAGVVAHEISHVAIEHSVCNLEKQQRVGIMAGIGQLASGVMLGDSAVGTLAEKGIGLTAGLGFLRMSRGAEKQADLEGVGILYDAGYDPRAMPQFFETVEAKYGKGGAQLMSDHPNPGNRTEYINREIATFAPRTDLVANTPEFRSIHQEAAKIHAYTAKEVSSGVWKRRAAEPSDRTGTGLYSAGTPVDANAGSAPPQNWTAFQGNGFSISVPPNWQPRGDRNSVQLAPPSGIGQGGNGQRGALLYGVVTGVYRTEEPGSLRQTFNALVSQLARENPGFEPGPVSRLAVGDMVADSAECANHSAGQSSGERDWIVGMPSGAGVRYFVFVAPESEFPAARPTFERILNSIHLQ